MHRLSLLLLVAVAWLSLRWETPPAPVGMKAPATEFSSARAKKHIEKIAAKPHPVGSAAHDEARDYLLNELRALGGEAHIQRGTAVRGRRAGTMENVVARWKGTAGRKAVLLVSHYDSVPTAPGASDAASGVATILETVRAVRAGPPLSNDLMVLLTDGEEAGLMGAELFAAGHPWVKDAGVVLNFEARGSGGPAMMFETSRGNGWLIRELAAAAPYPRANSLSYEVYRRMPNDTDLTVFKRRGVAGLNFAYIENILCYHTMLDDVAHLEEASLQHLGTYALSLVRRLGGRDLSRVAENDRVYFTIGSVLFHYPGGWAVPLAVLVVAACVAPLAIALRRRVIRAAGLGRALLAWLAALAVAPALVAGAWWGVQWFKPDYHSLAHGDTYNSIYYFLSFMFLTLAVTAAAYRSVGARRNVVEMMAGPLVVWCGLAITSAVFLPGASYLFTWPLAAAAAGFAVVALRGGIWWNRGSVDERARPSHALAVTLCALPAVLLLVPTLNHLRVAMTLRLAWVTSIVMVLLLGLLAAQLAMLGARRRWWPAVGALAVAACLAGAGLATAEFSREHPGHDSVFYALDADTGVAKWASADSRLDEWTSQFFKDRSRGPAPGFPTGKFLNSPAPAVSLPGPDILVIEDRTEGNARALKLLVRSPRQAANLQLRLEAEPRVQLAEMNGRRLAGLGAANEPTILTYRAVPKEGVSVVLRVAAGKPVRMTVVDQSYGLPAELQSAYRPRPAHIIPMSYFLGGDATLVARTRTFY